MAGDSFNILYYRELLKDAGRNPADYSRDDLETIVFEEVGNTMIRAYYHDRHPLAQQEMILYIRWELYG